jgi:hypothetical protein
MYADTLLALERLHLLRLLAWGAACVLLGTLLLAALAARRADSPLLRHFASQTAAWGAVDLALAARAWGGLRLRDYDGAAALARELSLFLGVEAGFAAAGVTIAVVGWLLGRRLAPVGVGLGVVVQAAALLVLDGALAGRLGPHV